MRKFTKFCKAGVPIFC